MQVPTVVTRAASACPPCLGSCPVACSLALQRQISRASPHCTSHTAWVKPWSPLGGHSLNQRAASRRAMTLLDPPAVVLPAHEAEGRGHGLSLRRLGGPASGGGHGVAGSRAYSEVRELEVRAVVQPATPARISGGFRLSPGPGGFRCHIGLTVIYKARAGAVGSFTGGGRGRDRREGRRVGG